MKEIKLKLSKMRKPQEFVIYPKKSERIILQSDNRVVSVNADTGEYFGHKSNSSFCGLYKLSIPNFKGVLSSEELKEALKIVDSRSVIPLT